MNEQEREDLRNKNIKLLEHSYDGIQEFDQKLPNWWLFTLYITIVFSVFYWIVRHQWLDGNYDYIKLDQELARVEDAKMAQMLELLNDDVLREFADNMDWVARGSQTYQRNCASCHAADLTGGIGPNLIDGVWIHGDRPTDMYHVINKGVPAMGMQPWEGLLSPREMAEVVAFLLHRQP